MGVDNVAGSVSRLARQQEPSSPAVASALRELASEVSGYADARDVERTFLRRAVAAQARGWIDMAQALLIAAGAARFVAAFDTPTSEPSLTPA